jgi:hypothetical protein
VGLALRWEAALAEIEETAKIPEDEQVTLTANWR